MASQAASTEVHTSRGSGSPVWYVTDGETLVGPVQTSLLLRGFTNARIPKGCVVAQTSWPSWRFFEETRENSLLERAFTWATDPGEVCPGLPREAVRNARDIGEALLLAMHAATVMTHAGFGLVHRVRNPFVGFVTSSARGGNLDVQLGHVLPRLDPVVEHARSGEALLRAIGPEPRTPLEDAIVRRFAPHVPDLRGIAMVPIIDGGNLLATIELARTDHPFRDDDPAILSSIAALVCEK